ncbi:hypothetical protein ZWY2020_041940 [Hordeum vulgare]|nr:hypothetical protein ZWY2020_041940 [Hordeum vulgare]
MRAARVLPMFLVPALASLIYSAITSLTKIRKCTWLCITISRVRLLSFFTNVNVPLGSSVDNTDQHTLEKLRAERQAKIDELKERTNYYTTQQLIQKLLTPTLQIRDTEI